LKLARCQRRFSFIALEASAPRQSKKLSPDSAEISARESPELPEATFSSPDYLVSSPEESVSPTDFAFTSPKYPVDLPKPTVS
jgi:hypothetical protein